MPPQTAKLTRPAPYQLDTARFAPTNRRRLSGPGLRTFLAIADRWDLTELERLLILGTPSRSTYFGWIKAARDHRELMLPTDTLIRISAILGIHQAMQILFAIDHEQAAWLKNPHRSQPFAGQPPIALIAGGTQDGLMAVRRFLGALRGGQSMAPNAAHHDAVPLTDDDIVFA